MSTVFKSALIACAVSTLFVFGYVAWHEGWEAGFLASALFFVFLWGFPLLFLGAEEDMR